MKKFYIGFTIFLLIYGVLMYLYLFQSQQDLPQAYVGGPADPTSFMSVEQLHTATIFSRIKDFLFFIGVPWEWAIYLIILGLGFSTSFYMIANKLSKRSLLVQTSIYVFLLSLLIALLQFPIQYYSYKISREYGISVQPFEQWIWDKGKSFFVDLVLTVPMVWLLYTLIRKSPKKWWFWFWLISIPITILMFFVQPVIIDPIFNDFQTLQDQKLKEAIIAIAKKADIPANQVFQVNMSKKTTAMNAYVTGIGSNARIVLWDTTLQKLKKDEILFVMAHEMGHYVYKHIYWMLLGSILSSFILLYLLYLLINWLVDRFGYAWGVQKVGDLRSLPLFLLLLSVITFAISPIENTISRQSERAADQYGIQMTQNAEAAISSFQKLTVNSLTEPNPPELVKIFLYSHPTMAERLYTISQEMQLMKQNQK
ncbi:M48 family metallopeptidase [Tepidibacillus sp. HK-1]|uniref:M48 family metallopeptidase n=1 Tax=Tepidibacillus sp. HK-1 TaxID=1883407 RepID=UPI00085306A9|nr:M48 family metallopeptidase [Tepidibacillus sp. HK-1]GBF10221.1 hypothetical protein HK1_00233 [Tepidibacillus sp. HK-1]